MVRVLPGLIAKLLDKMIDQVGNVVSRSRSGGRWIGMTDMR